MSISPEGRTRGVFGGLRTGDYTPRELPAPRAHSKRRSRNDVVKTATELVLMAMLLTGFTTRNPVLWGSATIALAVEGAGIYLYNMSKSIESPTPKA